MPPEKRSPFLQGLAATRARWAHNFVIIHARRVLKHEHHAQQQQLVFFLEPEYTLFLSLITGGRPTGHEPRGRLNT